jgi:replicative DNA helicase
MSQLKPELLIELAKSCIVSNDILEVVKPHLQYSFIKQEPMKHIFKYIFDYHTAFGKGPTIGLVSQNVNQKDTLELIGKIRETNIYDKKEDIVIGFEEFIKRSRFQLTWKETEDVMNSGKFDEGYKKAAKEFADIEKFSLRANGLSKIFGDFDRIIAEAQNQQVHLQRIPTGIPAFDYHTRGGIELGTSFLGIGRSGVGKSTFLRELGFQAAFRRFNVLHFSAEGKKTDLEKLYTSMWTGISVNDFREGDFDSANWKKIEKARKDYLAQCGEIYVHAFEQFHTAKISYCRNILMEVLKTTPIHLVIFDYLEKFDPGDGRKYGTNDEGQRMQKMATAEKITNIGAEFKVATATFTQASSIDKEKWNNPNFVISRENISNLKATIDPFYYCVTLNQTMDENDRDVIRIHEEKFRHYKLNSFTSTYMIAQDRDIGKFINIAETKKRFWDDEKKQIIGMPKAA